MKSFYLEYKVYYGGFFVTVLFIISYFIPVVFEIGIALLIFLLITIIIDSMLLYKSNGISARRLPTNRFSCGNWNKVELEIENHYPFTVNCTVIDELPYQFQERKWRRHLQINSNSQGTLKYVLKPLQRGEYE
ncbi:MAG: DUF58 domain-containing protein, partial [Chitinophagaceae bacterium]|nr:DUF58 domain-containing protein [Chitinophagaceae bacterium]